MLEENLSKHCRNKHNAAKRIAGEQSASDMFGGSVKKAKKDDADTEKLLATTGGRQTPDDLLLVGPDTPDDILVVKPGETPTPDVPHRDIFEADYSDSERLADLINVVKGIHINSEESKQSILILWSLNSK